MDIATTVSVGTAVVVFFLTVLVLPLVRYIVVAKDRQIDELKVRLDKGTKEHGAFGAKLHDLELKVTRLEGEVELANGVHSRLDKLTDRMDKVVSELSSMQTAFQLLMKGGLPRRSATPSPFASEKTPSG